jgi:hypothetical protein
MDHEHEPGRRRKHVASARHLRVVDADASDTVPTAPAPGEIGTIGRLIAKTALLADSAVTRHQRELPKLKQRWGRFF